MEPYCQKFAVKEKERVLKDFGIIITDKVHESLMKADGYSQLDRIANRYIREVLYV